MNEHDATNGHDVATDLSMLRTERVRTSAQLEAAWQVRREVFVEEQQVPIEEEMDAADTATTTTHVIVVPAASAPVRDLDDVGHDRAQEHPPAVATGRLLTDPAHPGVVHIGRVAVLARWRTGGVGALVMRALEDLAARGDAVDGAVRVELSAQEQAIGFYERLGYTVTGERYLDAGIWHRDAHKTIDAADAVSSVV